MRLVFPPIPRTLDSRPPADVLVAHPWERVGADLDADDWAWDYTVDLAFIRPVEIEPRALAEHLGLPYHAQVRLVAEWSSSLGSMLRGASHIHQFGLGDETQHIELRLDVAGAHVGGQLKLETHLCLVSPDIAPPGTEVWTNAESIDLERHAPRIPVAVVHFSEFPSRFIDQRALWSIEILTNGYHMPISTALQVFLNGDDDVFVSRVTGGEDEFSEKWFAFEVARHLVQRALLDDLFAFDEEYDPGTLGDSLKAKVRAVFSPRTPDEVRSMLATMPHEFDAILQTHMFGG